MKSLWTLGLLTCISLVGYGQRTKPLNLPDYDKEKLHFGFTLSVNKADFVVTPAVASIKPDSVLSVECVPDWGFNLGIVSDLRLHNYVTLRFLPTLSFQGRALEYRIHPTSATKPDTFFMEVKKVESTLLEFPINLKIRSERWNNLSAYLLAGGRYCIDLASQMDTKNNDIVKLNKNDLVLDAGFGLDFYLEYFKLSTEIKFCAGFKNRLYHEPTPTTWSAPLERLNSKYLILSLNFEG